jgi:hypothetical protein
MYLDGNLVDCTFPVGTLRMNAAPVRIGSGQGETGNGFQGKIEGVSIWNRALSEAEIVRIAGGEKAVAEASLEIFGEKPALAMHYLPKWPNAWINETVGADYGGAYHIYYSVWSRGFGVSAICELHTASSKDLGDWYDDGIAIPIDRQWEGYWLGEMPPRLINGKLSIAYCNSGPAGLGARAPELLEIVRPEYRDGKRVYSVEEFEQADVHLPEKLPRGCFISQSEDGIRFEKSDVHYGTYHSPSFMTDDDYPGLLFYPGHNATLYASRDGKTWEFFRDDLIPTGKETGYKHTDECWHHYEWNGWHYMFAGVNLGSYMSRKAMGPYWAGANGQFEDEYTPTRFTLSRGFGALSVFKTRDNRTIVMGMVPHFPEGLQNRVGGTLIVHEVVQHPDGQLGSKWVRELVPETGRPIDWKASSSQRGVDIKDRQIRIAADGLTHVPVSGAPRAYILSATVVPEGQVKAFGLNINGGAADQLPGTELRFEPAEERVQYGRAAADVLAPRSPASKQEAVEMGIQPVSDREKDKPPEEVYWKEYRSSPIWGNEYALSHTGGIDKPFKLEVMVHQVAHNDKERNPIWIIDANIDDQVAMVNKRVEMQNIGNLSFFANNGTVRFENIKIRPLK